jgi:enoyl-CoA hydratase / 3-hydroxyacyl-CoA dehydrogenase
MEEKVSIQKIAVIGGGLMGYGIAQVAASAGQEVCLIDLKEEVLATAMQKIEQSLDKLWTKKRIKEEPAQTLGRIHPTLKIADGVKDVDCVIEAVFEDINLKKKVMAEVDAHAPEHAILATNSSGLSVTLIAEGTNRPEKVIGMHWMNPPQIMKLIEIIKSRHTNDETVQGVLNLCQLYGKEPVLARKDVWYFLAARARTGWSIENNLMYLRKEADHMELDAIAKYTLGLPMGEFEIFDFTGAVDIRSKGLASVKQIVETFPEFEPWPPLLEVYSHLADELWRPMSEQGLSGVKTGKGFYDYPGSKYVKPDIPKHLAGKIDPLQLIAPAVNAAAWCIDHGIGTVEDINTSFRLAFGWPKGIFEFIGDYGIGNILKVLQAKKETAPDWLDGFYDPAPVLNNWQD